MGSPERTADEGHISPAVLGGFLNNEKLLEGFKRGSDPTWITFSNISASGK